MTKPITEAFAKVIELAEALNVQDIYKLEGCWTHSFGDWQIALNGHPHDVEFETVNVPPYNVMVKGFGMFLGLIGPYEGVLLGGAHSEPENDFINAIQAEIDRLNNVVTVGGDEA